MKITIFIKKYIKQYKGIVLTFIISSLLLWVCEVTVPYLLGVYLDSLVNKVNVKSIFLFTGLILAFNLINIASQYVYAIFATKLNNKVSFDINYDIFNKLRLIKLTDIKKLDTAYLMDRINQDVGNLVTFFSGNVVTIFTNVFTILMSLLILLKIDPIILLFEIIVIPVYILVYHKFKRKLYTINYDLADKTNYYFSKRTDQVNRLPFIKVNVLFEEMNHELKNAFICLYQCILKQVKINYLFSNLSSIILAFSYIVIIFYGGLRVISGKLSIGNYTIINTYFNLVIISTTYYLTLSGAYQQVKVSKDRIDELLNVEVENNGLTKIDNFSIIEVKNLTASFHEKQLLLNNITMEFQINNVYCIKGCNGIGKTTFINILLGLYHDIYQGTISFDSHDLKDLDMYYLRRFRVSVVEQEFTLLNISIYQYLTMGINEVDTIYINDTIHQYCDKLNILHTIENLPNKFDTIITEGGNTFSGGEKQKLSIIRSLLKNSNLLIYDEPTSALDMESITQFKNIIMETKIDKIIIIITHDKRVFDICDHEIDL